MSQSRSSKQIDYSKFFWIYQLNKPELIQTLDDLNLKYSEDNGIDNLRKILRKHIKSIKKSPQKKLEEKKDLQHLPAPALIQQEQKQPVPLLVVSEVRRKTHNIAEEYGRGCSKLEFQLGRDDWETYVKRLKIYFLANEVSSEKKWLCELTLHLIDNVLGI
ncbi:hypothetical protein PUN28_017998 [Cardiocondyla obscurior]|uniref:Uncharacterized protein n=1 Tax=Cardiocondyla obscurior TaxID=286306 RepID=A0AAW2EKQ8_9HYME